MGFVRLFRGFARFLLIVSFISTSIQFPNFAVAEKSDNYDELTAEMRTTLSSIKNPNVYPEAAKEIEALRGVNNPEILEVLVDRLVVEAQKEIRYDSNFIVFLISIITWDVAQNFKAQDGETKIDISPVIKRRGDLRAIVPNLQEKIPQNTFPQENLVRDIYRAYDSTLKALDHLGNSEKSVPEKPGRQQLTLRKPQPAEKNYDVLTAKVKTVIAQLENLSVTPEYDDVMILRAFNHPKIVEVSVWRMDKELKTPEPDAELIEELLHVLSELVARNDVDLEPLIEQLDVLKNIKSRMDEKYSEQAGYNTLLEPLMSELIKKVDEIRTNTAGKKLSDVKKRSEKIEQQAGETIATATDDKFLPPAERLKKFKQKLESSIIEQPEVIEAIYDLEFETMVKGVGNTKEPPFFYLMGLPGVGKDTSAEAYIDALYGGNGRDHMFSVPVQRKDADAWTLLGSATGYKGSDNLSPFIKFLVMHSAGKYIIKEEKGLSDKSYYVIENPDWQEGKVLKGYYPPEKAIVFLNEFHNWSSGAKAYILKESLEKGTFKINNPGKGVDILRIPGLRFVAASNEGIELYTNRDMDGSRYGEPLTYDEMMQRWEKVAHNKDKLKQTIAKTASKNAPGTLPDQQVGTPEEIINRTHPSRIILMRPISPEGLKKITQMKIEAVSEQLYFATQGAYGSFEISATPELVKFIYEYDYIAEDGARPIADKVRTLMEYPFYQALKDGNFSPEDIRYGVTLDVKQNEDKTYSLVVLAGKENPSRILREQPIRQTFKERDYEPISDEKIDKFADIDERLKDQVFGAEKAIEKIAQALLLSEEARHAKKKKWSDHEKATSFAFFGPSSTGKSEMAKAIVREVFPDYGEQRRVDIDFNKIQTQAQLEQFIWGYKNGRDVIPSEFMKKYDQYNGDILFVFEESTNTPKQLLKSLYDLFRENHPKFADGKDRPMTNVTIIMTGNAGIEWYSGVPRDLPDHVRMAAWARIYREMMKNPGRQRQTLEQYLPEPLVNRIGEQNIIWFAPLTFKAVRELALFKINNYISKMKVADGRRGWEVGFRNSDEHLKFVELIEREGFVLEEQGASIDRYVDTVISKSLRALLLKNKTPIGARVALVARDDQTEQVIRKQEKVLIDVMIEGQAETLTLAVEAKKRGVFPKENLNDFKMTAVHEAGHEFVGRVLLGDKHKSVLISVIPGVGEIGGEWVYWLGVRQWQEVERLNQTPEAVVRRIAGLLAGEVAQDIFSKGRRLDAGKSNDIEQATKLAQAAVGKWGLSPVWGNRSINDLHELSEKDRDVFNQEVMKLLKAGRTLAFNLLAQNIEVFNDLAYDLMEKGEIRSEGLEEYYSKNSHRIKPIADQTEASVREHTELLPASYQDSVIKTHNTELADYLRVPPKLANLDDFIANEKATEIAMARVPKTLPILSNFGTTDVEVKNDSSRATLTCQGLFR